MAAASINIPAFTDSLVVLATAGIVVPLVRRSGFSPVLGFLAAGALLGPLGLGSLAGIVPGIEWVTVVDARNVAGIAELGVVFLLFLIGLELSYERLMAMRRLVFGLGSLQIALSTLALGLILWAAGQKPAVAILIAACLSLSSTAIVLEVLAGHGRMASGVGRTSFSVLLAQDLAVIPILMFISILGQNGGGSILGTIAAALGQALVAVGAIIVVGRLVLRPLFRSVAAANSPELFIAAVLFVIVSTGFLAALAGVSMALGAFVAGLLLAETEYRKAIEATIAPFKGLLLGVFFFSVGMSIDVREVIRAPVMLVGSVAGMIALKAAIVVALARLYHISRPVALESALLLGPGGEFAFVGIGLASSLGLIELSTASFTLAVTSLTMALIPLLGDYGRRHAELLVEPVEAPDEIKVAPDAKHKHAIVIGYGRVGKVVSRLLEVNKVPFVAIDNDPKAVTAERRRGGNVFYGDATSPAFLKACGLGEAAGVIITMHARPDIDAIVANVRQVRPEIPIISRARDGEHARHLYRAGATDAVPETIEASLQLSEATLVWLGVPTGLAIASIHEQRDEFRKELQEAASSAGRRTTHGVRARTQRR